MTHNRSSEHEAVKAARRHIIHHVVYARSPDMALLLAVLEQRERAGKWPEAHWAGARKGPPDHQQVTNYLAYLVREKKVGRAVGGLWMALSKPEDRPLRKHAAAALQLKSEGKAPKRIAELLGLSNSLVYRLLDDPYGEKERERKRNYCPACGAKKEPALDWCRKCKTGKAEDLLPPADFMRYVHRAWRERGLEVVIGVTVDLQRVVRIKTDRGIAEHVLHWRESWDTAMEETGLV